MQQHQLQTRENQPYSNRDDTIVTLNRFWDTAQDVAMTCLALAKRTGSSRLSTGIRRCRTC